MTSIHEILRVDATKEDFPLKGSPNNTSESGVMLGAVFFGLKNEATGKFTYTKKNWNDLVILAILRWWPFWEAGVTWPFDSKVGKVTSNVWGYKGHGWVSTWIIGFLTTRIGKSYASLDVIRMNLPLYFTSDDNIYKQVGIAIPVVLRSEDLFLFDRIKPWICSRCLEKAKKICSQMVVCSDAKKTCQFVVAQLAHHLTKAHKNVKKCHNGLKQNIKFNFTWLHNTPKKHTILSI